MLLNIYLTSRHHFFAKTLKVFLVHLSSFLWRPHTQTNVPCPKAGMTCFETRLLGEENVFAMHTKLLMFQDCDDPNPLIRALAVRTMGCIRVDKITEYLCEPLRKCLKDEDPYVRKTAAVCVAKLHDINAQLVEDQGFLDQLKELLSDSNPMVMLSLHSRILIKS